MLGDLVGPVTKPVAQLQQGAATRRDAGEDTVEITGELGLLLLGRLGNRDQLEDRGIDRIANAFETGRAIWAASVRILVGRGDPFRIGMNFLGLIQ